MELDNEEIKETKKIGKTEMTLKEAIHIVIKEKYKYIVPGSRLDLALELIIEKILKKENFEK